MHSFKTNLLAPHSLMYTDEQLLVRGSCDPFINKENLHATKNTIGTENYYCFVCTLLYALSNIYVHIPCTTGFHITGYCIAQLLDSRYMYGVI